MTVSYQWLSTYLPVQLPIEELSHILTSIGLEVEGVDQVDEIPGGLAGLVIGEVLTCVRHANADKLSVTTVNLGGDAPVQIVCGAPNVAAGQKVVVAPVGATVHPTGGTPFPIKKAKIRGEASEGMICAEDEIGLGSSHAGIMILPDDAPVGTLARTYFNIAEADFAIHIGLTPNRSDANSHIGVARDICAYLSHHKGGNYQVQLPGSDFVGGSGTSPISVTIQALQACPRYTGVYITNVKVGESPKWLVRRLAAIGVRSINNVVDITNYVLHEFGQPLHAFDADKIQGGVINVDVSAGDEPFLSLDGKTRTLKENDIVIKDGTEIIGLGGVFGGAGTGISETTQNVFLESAYFTPMFIRRTSLHHVLRTDAALHFEKGVDVNNVLPALIRAAQLIVELAGGDVFSKITDIYPEAIAPKAITVSYGYINKLSGKSYNEGAVKNLLRSLGFQMSSENAEGVTVEVPSNKTDISQPADIVEEILRIDGLDNIELSGRLEIALVKPQANDRVLREQVAELLCGMGLQEITTNSIINSKYYPEHTNLVRMINSLSSELDIMRPSMLESGLEVIQYNYNRKNQDLFLYELGSIYHQVQDRYIQEQRLAIWMTGNINATNWNQPAKKCDIFHVKGVLNALFTYCGIPFTHAYIQENGCYEIAWKWKNTVLARLHSVPVATLKTFDIKQEVYFAEVHWDDLVKAKRAQKIKYAEVPKYPAVNRDLAIVLDATTAYQRIQEVTKQLNLEPLQQFGLFDVFESEKLGAGKKSFALNFTFQLADRTLTDAETEQLMNQLITAYSKELDAQVR